MNRNNLGGPVLNAIFLKKFMGPAFETKLICGNISTEETNANHLFEQYGVDYDVIPGMERSINPLADYKVYANVKKIIAEYQPHIIHTHAAKAGAIGRMAAAACKTPVVLHTFHGHVFHSYFSPFISKCFVQLERYLAKKSSRIIAISESQRKELGEVYRVCPPEKIVTIPNGIDLEKFRSASAHFRTEWRRKYNIREDEVAVGIVGRLTGVKNHGMFVKVVKSMLNSYDRLKPRFFIIGDGEIRNEIIGHIQEEGLSCNYFPDDPLCDGKDITLTSWEKETDKVYAGLDIAVLTSHNEGTPITLMEACAAGLPVVSTNVGGVKDVLLDKKSGWLTAPDDVEAFTSSLAGLVANPVLRQSMGKAGQEYVLAKYSYHRLVKDMEHLYTTLITEYENKSKDRSLH